jgi:alcohol dehydrogenase class IV
MSEYSLRMPGAVYAGDRVIEKLPEILKGAKRVALFTDKGVRNAGLVESTLAVLGDGGLHIEILDDLPAEPTIYQAAENISRFRAIHADHIIAIGGGSVMDIAKLASVLDTDAYSIFDLLDDSALAHKCVPTLMIPTTAGTGAEATPNAIITVPEKSLKVGIVNFDMIADAVVLDAEMLRHLPRKIAASTGIDALAHAIECFTSKKATPFSDMVALEAFRLIEKSIERACDESNQDMKAKSDMLLASFYAGVAISAAGTTAVHALSYPLGGRYQIAHGISNAILLMPVMRFNEPVCQTRFAAVYDTVRPGGEEKTVLSKSSWVLNRMDEIVQNVGIVPSLQPYGIGSGELDALVRAGMQVTRLLVNNLRPVTSDDARKIYMEVI